ncbi:Poly(A) polymerase I [Candidatus Clavichlamydia salmonicola]|uniref:polynucleotide adenylyltransferase PcnB n=1 Tax=Candidatus Clavichlamydia salmonicola TaxID=469812 RepID=UPI001891B13C|nr:polynucleotide adenylyltransferase PcnB [Candidatus Clavichlamydia salmonicola]MBF5050460.1 Poly(A) polymerase I [Candidatus Clavichlamydia salmonicola]
MTPQIYPLHKHGIRKESVNTHALSVVQTLRQAGYLAYLVGGCIRDLLMKKTPKDFDVSTSAKPEEIKALFRNCILVGKRFRLAHIRFKKHIIEVSTFRSGDPEDESLIVRDNIWGTAEEDVMRRDFTINGIFYDAEEEILIDYTGGFIDLKKSLLRSIGNPMLRFKQDPVRMIRLLKFRARFNFSVEQDTLEALHSCKEEIFKSASARLMEEVFKILIFGHAENFFRLSEEAQMLPLLFKKQVEMFNKDPELKKIAFQYLHALDNLVNKGYRDIERPILIAALIFPLLDFSLKNHPLVKDNDVSTSFGFIVDFIQEFMSTFFYHSLTGCPKKILLITSSILQNQYRMIGLTSKTGIRKSKTGFLKQASAEASIFFLKIRSLVDHDLIPIYNKWKKSLHDLRKKTDNSDF